MPEHVKGIILLLEAARMQVLHPMTGRAICSAELKQAEHIGRRIDKILRRFEMSRVEFFAKI